MGFEGWEGLTNWGFLARLLSLFYSYWLLPVGIGFRPEKNLRWCQYGYTGSTALALSRTATCAAVKFHPDAARFWRNCSSLRAPIMTDEIVGRCKSQLSATCGT